MYSSMLDPYEPPRPRPIYDNPPVVHRRRSLLSHLFAVLRRGRPVDCAPALAEPLLLGDHLGRRRPSETPCSAGSVERMSPPTRIA
jgi:hypothetical protein